MERNIVRVPGAKEAAGASTPRALKICPPHREKSTGLLWLPGSVVAPIRHPCRPWEAGIARTVRKPGPGDSPPLVYPSGSRSGKESSGGSGRSAL